MSFRRIYYYLYTLLLFHPTSTTVFQPGATGQNPCSIGFYYSRNVQLEISTMLVTFLIHIHSFQRTNSFVFLICINNLGIFIYQLNADDIPPVIASLFVRNSTVHVYPTRQSNLFHLPLRRTSFAQRNITFSGPKYWNGLHIEIKQSPSLHVFSRKLKYHLLKDYEDYQYAKPCISTTYSIFIRFTGLAQSLCMGGHNTVLSYSL